MAIFVDENTKVVVQGITGRDGAFHTKAMLDYGTKIVAGVTPGKGGQEVEGIPVFDTMLEAVNETGANTSIIFVPPKFSVNAIYEAAEAQIDLIVAITEGIPALDESRIFDFLKKKGTRMIGPNSPGIMSPGKSKVGILPAQIFKEGNVGVISRSGTLTYEIVYNLTETGFGQSTCIGIGGDPIIGTNFIDTLTAFESDSETSAVVLIGEIGGTDEQEAAEFIRDKMTKPVVAFIAGQNAPKGKRMGHAGAIISGSEGTAAEKIAKFNECGVSVAKIPSGIPELLQKN
ncbi:succinate--CoA ligase subunit alpha [bacterium]|nr:succinate--CoA ligase subunit alpha [bacterium]